VSEKHINCFASWLLQSAQFETPNLKGRSAAHRVRAV
jgi:hypothetical protein